MRNYPATLLRVFENKLEAGYDTDEDIPFTKADLQQATEELGIEVRDVMEIPSAYSSSSALPDEITDHGFTTIEFDPSAEDEETYRFTRN